MTDSHEQDYFLERFELVKEMLHDGDVESAMSSLVDLREKGFINNELDRHIETLRDDPGSHEVQVAAAWIEKVIASIEGYGGDIFEMVEELSEAAMGISEAEWVDLESSSGASSEPGDRSGTVDEENIGGHQDVQEVDKLDDFDDLDDLDEFSDLEEFSALDEFSDLGEFSDLDGFDGLEDLSELEEFSDVDLAADQRASATADESGEHAREDARAPKADESGIEVPGLEDDSLGNPPSVDFAIIDDSPSAVMEQLSDEELEAAGQRLREQDQQQGSEASEDQPDSSQEASIEAADGVEFELSEISEEPEQTPAQIEENDAAGDGAGAGDAFALDLGLDNMDFRETADGGEARGFEAGDEPDVSEEILLEEPVDEEELEESDDEEVALDDRATRKHTVPDAVEESRPVGERETRKHRVPEQSSSPEPERDEDEERVDERHGNATKVAGLNEKTSNRQPSATAESGLGLEDSDPDLRATREQQSADGAAADMAQGADAEGQGDDDPLGAADDGFQLFSDSEADEMGLSYSSAEEEDKESVDPFDDDEELDPFEGEREENPFTDDDLFGDIDDKSPAEAPSGASTRMPDSPSGEARYRGAALEPPEHHRSSSGEIRTGSGEHRFDDMSDAFSEESEAESSAGGNEFTREKTQRNESLADLASSMKKAESTREGVGEPDEDHDDNDADADFDLGLSNPEQKNVSPGAAADEREDDDFDLGLSNPEQMNASPGSAADEREDDGFDLGLSNPELKSQTAGSDDLEPEGIAGPGSVVEESSQSGDEESESSQTFFGSLAPFQRDEDSVASEESGGSDRHRERDTSGSTPRIRFDSEDTSAPSGPKRDLQPTPASLSAVSSPEEETESDKSLDEDEFFDLADSLAQQSEASDRPNRPKYRGEPMVGESEASEATDDSGSGESVNPFAHEAPTGVQEALRESESSFVLEEIPAEDDEERIANDVLLDEAERLFDKGKFDSAKDLVESVLERDEEHKDALELEEMIDDELVREYNKKLGSLDQTPSLEIDMTELASLDLDSRAGFLLSQMDGFSSINDLIELSNMSRAETLSLLVDLMEREIISLE